MGAVTKKKVTKKKVTKKKVTKKKATAKKGVKKKPKNYEDHLKNMQQRSAAISIKGRDIGPIPNVKNVQRRESCRFDLKKFAKTYVKEAFNLKFSPIHLQMIARLEEAILHDALYAFACPRGTGKSTIARVAALWAVSYSHSKYVFLIGANAGKAQDSLDALKVWIRFLPEYGDDFPEITMAVKRLGGVANRASGMLSEGNPVMIEWSKDSVVFPTVNAPKNLPGYKNKLAPTSGTVIGVSGLTGDGLRGSLKAMTDGSQIRPDFVLLDDPQTDESSISTTQNQTREKLISGAVLGMAGPGRTISAVMPCTVISKGDMVDNLLDRSKHPLWRGTRTRMLDGWPESMDLWEQYFEIYQMNALLEPPNFKEANSFYRKNRKAMDKGVTATWAQRKSKGEVSAVQHAMNLYCRDPIMFFSEYQNDPVVASDDGEFLDTFQVMHKQHAQGPNVVPLEVETIKCFVDVQKEQFFVQIWGYSDNFDGFLLDYFSFPKQPSMYYKKRSISNTLSKNYPHGGVESKIYAGLNDLMDYLFTKSWKRESDGDVMSISRVGIDSRYKTTTVRRFYRDTQYREKVTLCMGVAYGAKRKPITQRPVKAGDRKGSHWFYAASKGTTVRTLEVDVSWWKTFFHQRLATQLNDPACFSLYKVDNPQQHRLVAEHFTSEYRVTLEGAYGKADEWSMRPGTEDNDFFDCAVNCAAIASFDGISMVGADIRDDGDVRPSAVDWSKWGTR